MADRNCQDALAELYRFIDGELDRSTRTEIERHLRDCSPCLEAFDFEVELHRVIADKCRDRVPDELRARIARALADAGAGGAESSPGS